MLMFGACREMHHVPQESKGLSGHLHEALKGSSQLVCPCEEQPGSRERAWSLVLLNTGVRGKSVFSSELLFFLLWNRLMMFSPISLYWQICSFHKQHSSCLERCSKYPKLRGPGAQWSPHQGILMWTLGTDSFSSLTKQQRPSAYKAKAFIVSQFLEAPSLRLGNEGLFALNL